MALLEVSDLTVNLQSAESSVALVEDVSFDIDRGETLCIVGESGSGKTVTAQTVIRLLEYVAPVETTGRVSFDGTDLTNATQQQMGDLRGLRVAMVFQECMEALNPTKRVGAQLEEVWDYHRARRDAPGAPTARERAVTMLRDVEMPDPEGCLEKYPHQLSGGMQQRAMIAMALMCDPELLIADEPTTALDVTIQAEILRRLRILQRDRGMASLLITHDMGIAAELADRIAVMYSGRIVEIGPATEMLRVPRHPYTAGLLACVPRPGQRQVGDLPTIPGNVPPPGRRPVGCRFAPRCERATDVCRSTEPKLAAPDAGGHPVACWHPLPPPVSRAAALLATGTPVDGRPEAAGGEVLVRLDDVTKIYARRARARLSARAAADLEAKADSVVAVDHISLELHRGELFGLVGETGSGKSTMGRLIGRLEDPTAGTITLGGDDLAAMRRRSQEKAFRRKVQMIFQDPYASIDPRFLVGRVVAEPLHALTGRSRSEIRARVLQLLADVGLPASTVDRRVDELSGGQRQRVAVARAMAVDPELIVADEPTSALDVSVQGQVMNVLLGLQRERGLTYLFISHNLSLVLAVADRIGVMYLGALIEVAPATLIAAGPAHPYTAALLDANPDPDAPHDGFEAADPGIGESEAPVSPSQRSGCRFRHRCPRAETRCADESPPLLSVGPARQVACHFPLVGPGTTPPPAHHLTRSAAAARPAGTTQPIPATHDVPGSHE
jgi:peptide/nickel transport system ATP-binding protein